MKNWMSEFDFGDDAPALPPAPPPPPPHRPYLPYAPPGSVHALPPSELWHPKPTASFEVPGDSDFGAAMGRGGVGRGFSRGLEGHLEPLEPIGGYHLILAELAEGPVLTEYEAFDYDLDDFDPTDRVDGVIP